MVTPTTDFGLVFTLLAWAPRLIACIWGLIPIMFVVSVALAIWRIRLALQQARERKEYYSAQRERSASRKPHARKVAPEVPASQAYADPYADLGYDPVETYLQRHQVAEDGGASCYTPSPF